MQEIKRDILISRAKALLADGTVNRVPGWHKGEFDYDITPAVFYSTEELEKDSVPAKFVDITKLGLVELTRKKIRKSLKEMI